MKKIIPTFLLSLFLFSSATNAFWWNKSHQSEIPNENNKLNLGSDSFFNDSFFHYHQNLFNPWGFSFPKISIPNNYPLDLEEKDNQLIAKIDVPHFNQEEIEIEVKNDRWLIIKGQKTKELTEEDTGDKKYYYRERSSGSFSRQVVLPSPVDKSSTTATYKDGTLTITLPKKSIENESTDKISITTD